MNVRVFYCIDYVEKSKTVNGERIYSIERTNKMIDIDIDYIYDKNWLHLLLFWSIILKLLRRWFYVCNQNLLFTMCENSV